MPEMTFGVRWPDGTVQQCYSPSLVIHDHFRVGETPTITEFRHRADAALAEASERVRATFGFVCTSAAETAHAIGAVAATHPQTATVEIVSMFPPLPAPPTGGRPAPKEAP